METSQAYMLESDFLILYCVVERDTLRVFIMKDLTGRAPL